MTPTVGGAQTREALESPWLLWCTAKFLACWNYPLLKSVAVRISVLLFIVGFCLTRAYVGLRGTQGYSHDAFMLLDGAWRMMNGQRPHIDFYSHVGVLTFAPTLAGLWITHGKPAAFAYGQALTGLILGLWAYFLGRRLLSDVPAALMCVAVTVMATSPSILGFPPFMIAPAMTYNRAGYALLALIFTEALTMRRDAGTASAWLSGISTGAALGALLFLKITYFVFAVFFLAVLIPFRPREKHRWTGLALAFTGIALVCSAYFGFNLKPIVKDLLTIAGARHLNWNWYMFDVILEGAGVLSTLSLMGAYLLSVHERREAARLLAVGGLAVCAVGAALIFGNYEQSGFPLAVFLAILIANAVISQIPVSRHSPNVFQALVLLFAGVFISVFFITNTLSLSYAVAVRRLKANHVPGFASPVLATFVPVDVDRAYADFVDDGLNLVQKHRRTGETIMSLDFTNPFSYGLGAKPALGGNTVMSYKTTFNDQHRQSAESLFGSADLVALPNPGHFSDDSLDMSIVRLYGPYLEQHFKLIGQSKDWKLYRRNS